MVDFTKLQTLNFNLNCVFGKFYFWLIILVINVLLVYYIQLSYLNFNNFKPFGKNIYSKIEENNLHFSKREIFSDENEPNDFSIFSDNVWIFNFNISQYSSVITQELNESAVIESLIMYDAIENKVYLKEHLKCFLKIEKDFLIVNPFDIIAIDLMPIDTEMNPEEPGYYKSIWNVKCNLPDIYNSKYTKTRVAVIDDKYFYHYQNLFNYSKQLITFQKPSIFKKSIQKKKAVANCVHMINNIDDIKLKRLFDWIDLHRYMGFAQLKLYLFNVTDDVTNKLINYEEQNFVEIVNYKLTSIEKVCYWSIKMLNKYPNSEVYSFLYKNCELAYKKHFFNITLDNFGLYNSHERINSNDCLLKFRYVYEYVSNYDFDEFIFPRQLETTNDFLIENFLKIKNCNDLNLKLNLSAYNIYDYIMRLTNLYSFKDIACFHFEHVIFINDYQLLVDKLMAVYDKYKNNDLESFKSGGIIKYELSNDYINFKYKRTDLDLLNKFKNFQLLYDCLNNNFMKDSRFDFKWNNIYACKMNMRRGKSIFNTNYTLSYYQHHTYHTAPNKVCLDVPINDGFVSHFRDNLNGFLLNQTYSFSVLKFDFEYYLFLLTLIDA